MLRRINLLLFLPSRVAVSSVSSACALGGILAPTRTLLLHDNNLHTPDWLKQRKAAVIRDRERRELERQGIDPDADDDGPWVDPEEQARLDAEKAERERKQRELEDQIRAKRDAEDAEKKDRFKKFRAQQLFKSAAKRKKDRGLDEEDGESATPDRHNVAGRTIVEAQKGNSTASSAVPAEETAAAATAGVGAGDDVKK